MCCPPDVEVSASVVEAGDGSKKLANNMKDVSRSAKDAERETKRMEQAQKRAAEAAKRHSDQLASSIKSQVLSIAGGMGLVTSAGQAVSMVMQGWREHIDYLRKGLDDSYKTALAVAQLKMLEQTGMVGTGAQQAVADTKARYSFLSTEEIASTAGQLAPLAQMQGGTVQDAIDLAIEAWARKGFQGSLSDVAASLKGALVSGSAETFGQFSFALPREKYEGMEQSERAQAVFGDVMQQVRTSSQIQAALQDPLARQRLAIRRGDVRSGEAMEELSGGYGTQRELFANLRASYADQNVNIESFWSNFWRGDLTGMIGSIQGKTIDPDSIWRKLLPIIAGNMPGGVGAYATPAYNRQLGAAVSQAGEYGKAAPIYVNTNPPEMDE